MASGTNFRMVVTSWTPPPSRAPSALVSVSSQIAPSATKAASRLELPSLGQKTAR